MGGGQDKGSGFSFVRIADVLKTGDRLSTEDHDVRRFVPPGFEVAVSAVPAGSYGGDFHGIVSLGTDCTAFLIGDVAGHDFSSSIVATSIMRYVDEHQDDLAHPNVFLHRMNVDMYRALSSVGRFFTVAVCVVMPETNILLYSNAGHPPALISRVGGGPVEPVGVKAMPLGFEKDLSFPLVSVGFMPGDRMLFYTDGVSGARCDRNEFGQERLESILAETAGGPFEVVRAVLDAMNRFCSTPGEADDRTVFCIRRSR